MKSTILAVLTGAVLMSFAQSPVGLFQVEQGQSWQHYNRAEHVSRGRFATLNWNSLLHGRGSATVDASAEVLTLNLFSDLTLEAQKTRVTWMGPDDFNWIGRVKDHPYSHVILSCNRGRIYGTVQWGGRTVNISTDSRGRYKVDEIDMSALYQMEQELPQDFEPWTFERVEKKPAPEKAGKKKLNIIDVVVIYTQDVVDDEDDIDGYIETAIELSNDAYINSLVDHQIQLVHSQLVDPGNDEWDWMKNSNEVEQIRDEYGADLVQLLTTSMSGCGIASGWVTRTKLSCGISNKTFPHEFGHNMGAGHDAEQQENPRGIAHGLINEDAGWRTIMAYSTGCNDCPRINNFSNPDVSHQGDPTGDVELRNNALRMNERSDEVANYRDNVVMTGLNLRISRKGRGVITSVGGEVDCGEVCMINYEEGTSNTLELMAIPDSGWEFEGWSGGCQGTGICIIMVDSNKLVTARFTNPNYFSLELIDADADESIMVLGDSNHLYLEELPGNITLEAIPAEEVGSVSWILSGDQTRNHTENSIPYALFADDLNGDYNAWDPYPEAGIYEITTIGHSQGQGGGEELGEKTIFIQIHEGTPPLASKIPEGKNLLIQSVTRQGLMIYLPQDKNLRLSLVSLNGVETRLCEGLFKSGTHFINFKSNSLLQGMYLLKVETPTSSNFTRIVIP